MKQPWLAALLSIILPGAGHLYNGRRMFLGIGLALFFGFLYYSVATSGTTQQSAPASPLKGLIALLIFLIFYLGVSYDAHSEAAELNRLKQAV